MKRKVGCCMQVAQKILWRPILAFILCVAILPFAVGLIPLAHFTNETIDVRVYPDEVEVKGIYSYQNPFPLPILQGFAVPFPVDKRHPEPYEIYAERLTPEKESLPLMHFLSKTCFQLYFAPHEKIEVKISYRQKAPGEATYILTTTKPWGQPLDFGFYTLSTHGTRIVFSNYPLNFYAGTPGFQKTKFMPEENWHFTWEKRNEKTI